jgi:Protein of unknown function (DUF4232)
VAALAATAGLIPAAAPAATTTAAAPAAASTPACPTSGLAVWMDTHGDGAAGSIHYTLNFTNLSGHPCTLEGSPGVSAAGLRGEQPGRPASGDHTGGPPAVRLANGATAAAVLAWNAIQTQPGPRCGQVTAAGLRVYPPGQFTSKVIPVPDSRMPQADHLHEHRAGTKTLSASHTGALITGLHVNSTWSTTRLHTGGLSWG